MSGPGRKRAERLREHGRDTTESFCRGEQPDPDCGCTACVRWTVAMVRRTVPANDLTNGAQ